VLERPGFHDVEKTLASGPTDRRAVFSFGVLHYASMARVADSVIETVQRFDGVPQAHP
jgi:hypothetical protein